MEKEGEGGELGDLVLSAGGVEVYMRRARPGDLPPYRGLRVPPVRWPEWRRAPSIDEMATVSLVAGGSRLAMVIAASPVPQVLTTHFMSLGGEAFFPPSGYGFHGEALALLASRAILEAEGAQQAMERIEGDAYLVINTYRLAGGVQEPSMIGVGGVGVLSSSALARYEVGLLWEDDRLDEGSFFAKPYGAPGPISPVLSLRGGELVEPDEGDRRRVAGFRDGVLRRILGYRAAGL